MERKNSFIVDFWEKVFHILSKISLFYWIRKVTKNRSYTFVEGWVLGNLIISILCSLVVYWVPLASWILYTLLVYGLLRVFEIIVYQLNVLLFDPYRAQKQNKEYAIHSATRMVVLLLHNYVEIMFWYTAVILCLINIYGSEVYFSWGQFVQQNVLCIATFDSDFLETPRMSAIPALSHVVFMEIISGLIMTLISLSRFIGLLPPVAEKQGQKKV